VAYLQSKIGDRATMSVQGVVCPYGEDCRSYQAESSPPGRSSAYFVTLEDLDNIVDYRSPERAEALDALLRENGTEPLTHEEVGELRAWLEENDLLQALREWLGDPSVTQPEMLELARLGEAKEPAFRSLVRQRGVLLSPPLLQQLAEELCAHLAAARGKGYKDATDPYVEATTKACPSCSVRSTHWAGHQCHHISPATNGCPNCHVKYCYRCLSTETENGCAGAEATACAATGATFANRSAARQTWSSLSASSRASLSTAAAAASSVPSVVKGGPAESAPGTAAFAQGCSTPAPLAWARRPGWPSRLVRLAWGVAFRALALCRCGYLTRVVAGTSCASMRFWRRLGQPGVRRGLQL
jgi:hypothetical protein